MGGELGWVGGRVTDAVARGDFFGGGSGDAYGNMRAVPGFPLRISAHSRSVAAESDFSKNPRNLRLYRFSPSLHPPYVGTIKSWAVGGLIIGEPQYFIISSMFMNPSLSACSKTPIAMPSASVNVPSITSLYLTGAGGPERERRTSVPSSATCRAVTELSWERNSSRPSKLGSSSRCKSPSSRVSSGRKS